MSTHFGTLSSGIQPPEKLQILWLLSPKSCSFSDAREISCIATEGFSRNGLFLKPNIARCYHLSYVRTTKEVSRKLGSFEHYDEVVNDWIDEKWLKWRNDPTVGDLHPTNPHVYRNTSFCNTFTYHHLFVSILLINVYTIWQPMLILYVMMIFL